MGAWVRESGEVVWRDDFTAPAPDVDVTDNPVVDELLDAKGRVIRQWRERKPIGYRKDV